MPVQDRPPWPRALLCIRSSSTEDCAFERCDLATDVANRPRTPSLFPRFLAQCPRSRPIRPNSTPIRAKSTAELRVRLHPTPTQIPLLQLHKSSLVATLSGHGSTSLLHPPPPPQARRLSAPSHKHRRAPRSRTPPLGATSPPPSPRSQISSSSSMQFFHTDNKSLPIASSTA